MNLFFCIASLALLAAVLADPSDIIMFEDEDGQIIIEDLSQSIPVPYGVSVSNLKFMYYNPDNQGTPIRLETGNSQSLENCGILEAPCSKFLIHGWQSNYKKEFAQTLLKAYMENTNCHVVAIDWEKYNSPYLAACSNVPKIAHMIATFIDFIVSEGVSLETIHLIGHSMGAHIAGMCAREVNGTMARLTGLDPAGPYFKNKNERDRLCSSDAKFVDVIHSSSDLGMTDCIGTADFYVNGGSNQNACANKTISSGCNHMESFRLYAKSIENTNMFPALLCKSQAEAQAKDMSACVPSDVVMGEDAIKTNPAGAYYV